MHTVGANTLHPSTRYVLFSTLNDFALMTGFHSTCDSSEKRPQKVSSCSFKPHRNYSNLFTSSNVGERSWIWIRNNPIPVPEGARNYRFLFTSSMKREIREFNMSLRRRQRKRQKSNRFSLAKQQLCTCITLFCTFLCRHCTNTTRIA